MQTFEGDGIPVTRAFPVSDLRDNDPFLLFDHFGPINYQPGGATGVPAHPHCGFEAITYLLGGEIEHRDSWGGNATIKTGDIQWMTTGSGLIHSELVTEKFKKSGKNIKISSKDRISSLILHLKGLLEKKGFFAPPEKKHSMLMNINNLIYRLEPNDKELRILASIISSLSKKNINHN